MLAKDIEGCTQDRSPLTIVCNNIYDSDGSNDGGAANILLAAKTATTTVNTMQSSL